jgi:hypothetical protein
LREVRRQIADWKAQASNASQAMQLHLGRKAFSRDQFHLVAETIEFPERGINVGCNANTLEFFVHDGHGKDVVFIEDIFRHSVRIGAIDVNISYCARLV